jgi:hypothetical protein
MLQVTAYVRDHPGESSNSVSYATGPHGIRIHGQGAVNRALSAGLIEDRGIGRAFELHITDTGRDALEAVWPRYADAHTWKATDVQALDPRLIEVTHRDSVDTWHDPRGVISTGTHLNRAPGAVLASPRVLLDTARLFQRQWRPLDRGPRQPVDPPGA